MDDLVYGGSRGNLPSAFILGPTIHSAPHLCPLSFGKCFSNVLGMCAIIFKYTCLVMHSSRL